MKQYWNASGNHYPDKEEVRFDTDFLNNESQKYSIADKNLVHFAFVHWTQDDTMDGTIDRLALNDLPELIVSGSMATPKSNKRQKLSHGEEDDTDPFATPAGKRHAETYSLRSKCWKIIPRW